MEYDPVPEIKRKHFEQAFKHARRSVDEISLNKYMQFCKDNDPNFVEGGGVAVGKKIEWGDNGGMDLENANNGEDDSDDDLQLI